MTSVKILVVFGVLLGLLLCVGCTSKTKPTKPTTRFEIVARFEPSGIMLRHDNEIVLFGCHGRSIFRPVQGELLQIDGIRTTCAPIPQTGSILLHQSPPHENSNHDIWFYDYRTAEGFDAELYLEILRPSSAWRPADLDQQLATIGVEPH
jgi:hypothetical protein